MFLFTVLALLLTQPNFAHANRAEEGTPTNCSIIPATSQYAHSSVVPISKYNASASLPPNNITDLPASSTGLTNLSTSVTVHSSVYPTRLTNLSTSVTVHSTDLPTSTSLSMKSEPTGAACAPYWLEHITHQGRAPFDTNTVNGTYQVFRNVKDFGAKGDGLTDDTAAIQRAISFGNRCAPGTCNSTTTTPATVYFPEGIYLVSSAIVDYYYTQIIGNPNCLPTLLAATNFTTYTDTTTNITSAFLFDADPYGLNPVDPGSLAFGATNVFFRQVRNMIFDTTQVRATVLMRGIHWPTAQTTSLQNLVFKMSTASGNLHEGVFVEQGSGGFMGDLIFYGGNIGFDVGNQQFTTRNMTFHGCKTAILQLWDWGWTYKSISINDCQIGIDISAGTANALAVGSVTLLDSSIKNTPIGIRTARTSNTQPEAAGSLYIENIELENVQTAVQGPNSTVYLPGTSTSSIVTAWADGHQYLPNGPKELRGPIAPNVRPQVLLDNDGKYREKSKPQYELYAPEHFISARDRGAKGDGVTDDTAALTKAIKESAENNKILFVDAGYYKVTRTIFIPPGARIVGEALASVILSSGEFFNKLNDPQPVVQIGRQGDQGTVEWSDMIVSTQGQQEGAVLIQWNLQTYNGVSGMWDVHTRIGGFTGSNLQVAQCPTTPSVKATTENLDRSCIAAYMAMHVTAWASGLYMENNWLWTADHDLDDPDQRQITIYTGRGLLIESRPGGLWLYGTAVEHFSKYQYQLVYTHDIVMGQIQTETAYYQPNPDARTPFPANPAVYDPVFTPSTNSSINAAEGFGLRIVQSNSISVYGAGLYSFFNNYNTSCSDVGNGEVCQSRILSLEGFEHNFDVSIYNLNTVGVTNMITMDGKDVAFAVDNNSTFVDTINIFRSGRGTLDGGA